MLAGAEVDRLELAEDERLELAEVLLTIETTELEDEELAVEL